MSTETTSSGAARPRKGRAGLYIFILVAVAGGVYAGARWHGVLAPMLGMGRGESGSADRPSGSSASGQLWTCGMHPQVIQDHPGDCPICHMKLTPLQVDAETAGADQTDEHAHAETTDTGRAMQSMAGDQGATEKRRVKYWWDPMMSPPYISDKPGKSPMGMDLVPVYEREGEGGAGGPVVIDPAVVQNMGVRVATVIEGPLAKSVRLVGYLDEAQPNTREVNLRVSGWIRRLHADTEGQFVEAGDPLFDLYSPDLQVAVEELISGRRAVAALSSGADESARQTATALSDAAVSRLELLGLERAQVDTLAKLDRAPPVITFVSPIAGYVTEKPVVEGAAVMMGDRVLRIVDYSTLWLDARVFEKDLPFVKVGQKVTANIASRPGEPIAGEVIFIHPQVDVMTRATKVRLAIPNPSLALRPGMYATVHAHAELAERAVMVPREAIIDTGDRQVAFVARAVGRFEPRKIRMGLAGEDGMVQVLEGLTPGEAVVTSGQFLIDSESRLREAIQKFLDAKTGQAQSGPPAAGPGVSRPRDSPGGASTPAVEASSQQQQKLDALVMEYLELSAALGTVQKASTPLDARDLITKAQALQDAGRDTALQPVVAEVAKAAESLRGHPLEHQREAFKTLSDKVIALVDALPPSAAVGGDLHLMHCPMAPGNWLQRSPDLANPYYADEMKRCGSLVRTIAPKGK